MDADYADKTDHREKTTRYVFTLDIIGISWISQSKKNFVLSTIEAEWLL